MNEEKYDVPMIEKHQAELHDMNLVHMNSNMKIVIIVVAVMFAISMLAMSYAVVAHSKAVVEQSKVFVDNYTVRTEKWLATLLQMQGVAVTEALNEEVQTRNVQQSPIP